MNTLEIPEKNIRVTYASSMEELKPHQALKASELLFLTFTGAIDVDVFKKLMGDYLLNRVNKTAKPEAGQKGWNYWCNEFRIAETMNFFFDIKKEKEDEQTVYEINPVFVKQLVPSIRVGNKKYRGCDDMMVNLSWNEYKDASVAVQQFARDREPERLAELAAALYRKKKYCSPDGEREYTVRLRDKAAGEFMKKRDIGFLFYNFLFFTGCMNYLREQPVEIDGQEINFKSIFKGGNNDSSDNIGLTGVLFSLAEGGVFGNAKETGEARFFDVLLRLYQINMQAKKLKK